MNPLVSLSCVALLALPLSGCMIAQIPSRHPIAGRQDMDFIKRGTTSRADVQTRLGREDEYYSDLRIACYRRSKVTYRQWLFILIFPMESRPGQGPSSDLAFIQYDDQEHVLRVKTARAVWEEHWRARAERVAGVSTR